MSGNLIAFIFILLLFAAALGEDYVFTLIYLLGGAFVAGGLWSHRAINAVTIERDFAPKAFLGEKVTVKLRVSNTGWLPVVWLQLHESFSIELGVPGFFRRVISLGPRAHDDYEYSLQGRKRGYYQVGPAVMQSGDILGLFQAEVSRRTPIEYLTVYPKIIPLKQISFPSQSPMGTLRHNQPIFEDPTRVLGKRDYVAGDSMRRVDWKSSAVLGRLQVKLYEPSIALETAIFLDMNEDMYNPHTKIDDRELAIVVAASVANWIAGAQQSVGLYTNGKDSYQDSALMQTVPPRRGREHLMRILETLARVGLESTGTFPVLLRNSMTRLSWGTTLIMITGSMDEEMFDGLFQARRAGLDAFLVIVGRGKDQQMIRQRASHFGFPVHLVTQERDLDIWRK